MGGLRLAGEPWMNWSLIRITPRDIKLRLQAVRDGWEGQKPRPYAANRYFTALQGFFKWTVDPTVGLLAANPMAGAKKPFNGERPADRVYNSEELSIIWDSAAKLVNPYIEAHVRFVMMTGKRKRAAVQMRYDEINRSNVWVPTKDHRAKNKLKHPVPLLPQMRELIDGLDRVPGNPCVFVGKRGGHLTSATNLLGRMTAITGIADFNFHALRHTAETRLAELGVSSDLRDRTFDHAPARGAGSAAVLSGRLECPPSKACDV